MRCRRARRWLCRSRPRIRTGFSQIEKSEREHLTSAFVLREIPAPAGENAGVRDDPAQQFRNPFWWWLGRASNCARLDSRGRCPYMFLFLFFFYSYFFRAAVKLVTTVTAGLTSWVMRGRRIFLPSGETS